MFPRERHFYPVAEAEGEKARSARRGFRQLRGVYREENRDCSMPKIREGYFGGRAKKSKQRRAKSRENDEAPHYFPDSLYLLSRHAGNFIVTTRRFRVYKQFSQFICKYLYDALF